MKNNNFKNIFLMLSAFLTITVVLSACTTIDDDENKDEKNSDTEVSQTMSKSDLKDLVFADDFDTEEYYAQVGEVVKSIQTDIALEKAQSAQDIEKCEMLSDENSVNNCKDDFYLALAEEKQDPSLCSSISDEGKKLMCTSIVVNEVASNAETADDCDSLSDPGDAQDCKDTLLRKEAMDTLDATKCDGIVNTVMAKACKDMIEKASK